MVLLVAIAWMFTHLEILGWLGAHYARPDRRLEALLLGGVVLFGLTRARRGTGSPGAGWVLLGVVAGEALVAPLLDLQILRALLFLIGACTIVAMALPPRGVGALLPWTGLVAATLPVGAYADVYLGFPARLLVAEVVGRGLDLSGIASVSRETVLVLDHGTLDIAAPCAGMRSAWAGAVVLLALACVEGRRLDRWLVVAAVVTGAAIFLTNTLRVATLVVLRGVLELPLVADLVHAPLGVVGFVWSMAAGWLVLRRAPPVSEDGPGPWPRLPGAVLLGAVGLVWLVTPEPIRVSAPPVAVTLPFEPVEPTRIERVNFPDGALSKWRFEGGTVLVLPTRDWRVHHDPQACLLSQGLAVAGPWTEVTGGVPVRVATVDGGRGTAVWWFQSPERVTDDLTVRTWAAVTGDEDEWVLVSLLFDGPARPDILEGVRSAVARGLEAT